jgi:hypothetical protein
MSVRFGVAFFAIAVLSSFGIIYWGVSRGDDDLFDRSDDNPSRIDALVADGSILDDIDELNARQAEEIRIVAQDLVGWSAEAATDDDALLELVAICDRVPPPPRPLSFTNEDVMTLAPHEAAVGQLCEMVRQGVVRRTAPEWQELVRLEVPRLTHLQEGGGKPAVDAHVKRLTVWADHVLAARSLDADYAVRFCERASKSGFGSITSPPLDDAGVDRLTEELIEVCAIASSAATAVELADAVKSSFSD